MKRLLLSLVVGLLGGWVVAAEADPPTTQPPNHPTTQRRDPSSSPDVQDVVFYGKTRPVLIRLHIFVDGKPHSEVWDNYIQKRFDYADRDGNGYLDPDEVRMIPSAQVFQQMILGAGYFFFNGPAVRFEELDSDGDGKVTLAELKEYYQKLNVAAVRLLNVNQVYGGGNFSGVGGGGGGVGFRGNQNNNGLSEALFRHLDLNKDGKLSKEELAVADRLVARLDSNDDETVDAAELMQGQAVGGVRPPQAVQRQLAGMMPGMPGGVQGSFFLVPREREANRLTQRLILAKEMIARYDKDKSGKLTREEIGLDEELFKLLDRNEDRVLDVVELLRYVVLAPDVELTVNLGGKGLRGPGASGIAVTPGSKANLARALRRVGPDAMVFGVPNARIEVRRPNVPNYGRQPNPPYANFLRVFRSLDRGNKGFVELKAMKQPQMQYLRGLFEMADRDGDGKVTRKEFEDLLQLQGQAPGCVLTLSAGELGQGLFEILDTNRDGRLSVRELRTAWQRLAEYDRKNVGAVSNADIPHQFQLALTLGGNVYAAMRPLPGQQPPDPLARVPRPSTAGPLWFRKMDRNRDGDISPREFLGTPEQFKAFDLDGDGLISLEEAEKVDARLRKARQLP